MTAGCASEGVILDLVSGRLDVAARSEVERHIAACDECRRLVAALARTSLVGGTTITSDASASREDGAQEASVPRVRVRVRPGDTIGEKYVVERVIGQGGMGIVVLAMHEQLGQRVAIKFLLHEAYGSTDTVKRLLREARATAQLTSEHVTKVTDVGTFDDGAPYMVMEHLRGMDLAAVLGEKGPMPVEQALVYVLQACEGVAEAHALGIIHRDLKPANLFVTSRADGSPLIKVLDFGIAKAWSEGGTTLTSKATLMGSPRYMSPEQMTDARAVDARTDVWGIGAILYELVSGKPAFDGESVVAVCTRVATMPAPHLKDLGQRSLRVLDATIQRCLEKEPSARFQSIAEIARALAPIAPEEAQVSVQRIERMLGVKPSKSHRTASPRASSGRARVGRALMVIGSLVILSVGTWAWLGRRASIDASTGPSVNVPVAPSVSVDALPARETSEALVPRAAASPQPPAVQSSQPSESAQAAPNPGRPGASSARASPLPSPAPSTSAAPTALEPVDAGALRYMDRRGFTDRN